MNPVQFGKFLAEERRAKNMTQKELAERVGVTDKAVSKWERGVCFPDVAKFDQIADALDVTDIELFRARRMSLLSKPDREALVTSPETGRLFTGCLFIACACYVQDILEMAHVCPIVGFSDALFIISCVIFGAVSAMRARRSVKGAFLRPSLPYIVLTAILCGICVGFLFDPFVFWDSTDRIVTFLFHVEAHEVWPGNGMSAWSFGLLLRWFLRIRIFSMTNVAGLLLCLFVYPAVLVFRRQKWRTRNPEKMPDFPA